MRKIIKKILILLSIMTLIINYSVCMAVEHKIESKDTYATAYSGLQYAYSVGTFWGVNDERYGGDFRTNVYNAANKYSQISGVSSYYNTEPDYTYMRGNNPIGQRRIGSYLVFLNGYGGPEFILAGSKDTTENRTGVFVKSDTAITFYKTGKTFTLAGLGSTNMSGTRLIVFAGCSTGAWPTSEAPVNLPTKAVQQGADVAFGFRDPISSRVESGQAWLNAFNQALVNGYTVDGANVYACTQYPNSDLSTCSMAEGNYNLTIVPVTRATSMLQENIENEYKKFTVPKPNINVVIDEKNSENEKALSECEDKYKEIIEIIRAQDNDFNIDEYKVSSNCVNKENGVSHIYFTKYINDNIRTNKVYLIKTNKNIVNDIIVAGIKKDNIKEEKKLDRAFIEEKISKFNNEKIETVNNKLECNNVKSIRLLETTENLFEFNDNIEDIEEYYYYDYNIGKLKYIMEYSEKFEFSTTDRTQIEIDIE